MAAGATSKCKGLDLLLEACSTISSEFRLIIIGKATDFSKEYIEKKSSKYANKVILRLEEVSDKIFEKAIVAADCVVLPYTKGFNGRVTL